MIESVERYPISLRPQFSSDWPEDWKDSYHYDLVEVWDDKSNPGYSWSYRNRRAATIESILAICSPPARILDLAAASGNFSIALATLGYDVTWNDLRGHLIDYVRLKLPSSVDVAFVGGNIFDLGEEYRQKFDVVLATEVIEHVAHPDQFLRKLSTFVRPKGHVIITTPNGAYFLNRLPRFSDHPDPSAFEHVQFKPNSDGHIFLLYEDEVLSLAHKAGLTVEHLDLITNPLTSGHIKLRYLHPFIPSRALCAIEGGSRRLPRALRSRLSSHIVATLKRS
ncbi:MAG: methyltransferase domain-containing protein [Hyphomicrobiaceae bacterium]